MRRIAGLRVTWDPRSADYLDSSRVMVPSASRHVKVVDSVCAKPSRKLRKSQGGFVESSGVDPSTGAIEEMIPDQHEEIWYLVSKTAKWPLAPGSAFRVTGHSSSWSQLDQTARAPNNTPRLAASGREYGTGWSDAARASAYLRSDPHQQQGKPAPGPAPSWTREHQHHAQQLRASVPQPGRRTDRSP